MGLFKILQEVTGFH